MKPVVRQLVPFGEHPEQLDLDWSGLQWAIAGFVHWVSSCDPSSPAARSTLTRQYTKATLVRFLRIAWHIGYVAQDDRL